MFSQLYNHCILLLAKQPDLTVNFQADELNRDPAESLEELNITGEANHEVAYSVEAPSMFGKIHLGGVEEENAEDLMEPR